jgi:hypothetical protein
VCLNNDETNILKYKSNNYEVYEEYDAHENFIYEKKDPTATLGFSQTVINNLFYQGIRGVRNVDQIVNNLDNFMKNYTYEVTKKEKDYFKYYIDKE